MFDQGRRTMKRVFASLTLTAAASVMILPGCGFWKSQCHVLPHGPDDGYYVGKATELEYTDVCENATHAGGTRAPLTVLDENFEYRNLNLQECVQYALQNSEVLRDLGGALLRSPSEATVRTIYRPAISESDPRFGTHGALSAFDAQFAGSATFNHNDRALNNQFFGGGTRLLKQDTAVFQGEISKLSATGTEFSVRNITDYDANNAPGNTFPSAWTVQMETELRHPLLQGAGVEFNRIAGPSTVPGVFNGVLIARVNQDIAQADFEFAVRNLVNDVENAYLDLYYAYRDLDAKIAARDAALDTWRTVKALYDANRRGGEADKEAQAREQYYRFQEQLENSLHGRLVEGTRGNNGSSGGTFRATGGVLVAERRLRYLIGMPVTDDVLLRPSDEPHMAEVLFDWDEVLCESLQRRVELRRQRWNIKNRELELKASENFTLPRFDLVGLYRWRGFGRDLLRQHESASRSVGVNDPVAQVNSRFANRRFNNAYDNLFNGDFQEWQLGAELSFPIGHRRALAGVRNAELRLANERAILRQQEENVVLDLSNSYAELKRAFKLLETNYNRRIAADQQVEAVQAAYKADNAPLDLLLDAQRRRADADTAYYRALVEYAVSVKNVHFEKGSLLDYNGVYLEEGPWPMQAYQRAHELEKLKTEPWRFNWLLRPGTVVSSGPTAQLALPQAEGVAVPQDNPLPAQATPQEPAVETPAPGGDNGAINPPLPQPTNQ